MRLQMYIVTMMDNSTPYVVKALGMKRAENQAISLATCDDKCAEVKSVKLSSILSGTKYTKCGEIILQEV